MCQSRLAEKDSRFYVSIYCISYFLHIVGETEAEASYKMFDEPKLISADEWQLLILEGEKGGLFSASEKTRGHNKLRRVLSISRVSSSACNFDVIICDNFGIIVIGIHIGIGFEALEIGLFECLSTRYISTDPKAISENLIEDKNR